MSKEHVKHSGYHTTSLSLNAFFLLIYWEIKVITVLKNQEYQASGVTILSFYASLTTVNIVFYLGLAIFFGFIGELIIQWHTLYDSISA